MSLLSWISLGRVSRAARHDALMLRQKYGETAELFCDAALDSDHASERQLRHIRQIRRALRDLSGPTPGAAAREPASAARRLPLGA
jgi:hypothetical protein